MPREISPNVANAEPPAPQAIQAPQGIPAPQAVPAPQGIPTLPAGSAPPVVASPRAAATPHTILDGRRRRSAGSRQRIIAATMALVQEGHPEPAAEAIAERAGVGLRTVFRLFRDMESICAEMLQPQRQEFVTCFTATFASPRGSARLRELYQRLAALYEVRLPVRRAGMIRRYSSPSLSGAMRELNTTIAAFIEAQIPGADPAVQTRRDMLNLLMSFEAWMRLRDDQGLSQDRALAVLTRAIDQQLVEETACGT